MEKILPQEIIIIAAMAENRVIGKDNAIPWSIKGNLAHFKEVTMDFPCIMGRKTWESLPKKPLPGRLNIVVSKTLKDGDFPDAQDVKVFSSLDSAIEYCEDYEKVFICGGEAIYKQAMPLANKLDLTLIPGQYDGDTYFPEIDNSWIKKETADFKNFSVVTYEREKI
jgi:dihydrofolate reductase